MSYQPEDPSAGAEIDETDTSALGRARPRRHDDEDEGSDTFEDDDMESTVGGPTNGNQKSQGNGDEEIELPAHACALVLIPHSCVIIY
jgi:regulator of nonsense transcripts 1